MSEREQYPAGVPCWVETLQPNPRTAIAFYSSVFGWEFAGPGRMPGDPPGEYFVARVKGRDVAGVGSLPGGAAASAPAWTTHIRVDDAERAAAAVERAGGQIVIPPFDAPPAGRLAVLCDPSGAVFCAWEARARQGAQLVNEPRAWAMSVLQTSDQAVAAAFYRAVFGWEAEPFGPAEAGLTLFRLPGYVGGEPHQPVPRDVVAVMTSLLPGEAPAFWGVDFWVEDADLAAEKASRLGGDVVAPPRDTPGFRSAILADPHGAVFSVSRLTAAA